MKRRSFFNFLAAGIVVLLLTGIGGCNWLMRESPLTLLGGGSQTTPAAAMLVSKQSPVIMSLLVNPDRIEGWRRRSPLELNQLKTSLLANTGLEYRRDIQPWLGNEITLAVSSIDIDRDAENGRQTGYLMALATVDPAKSREFLELLFSKRAIAGNENKVVVEQYKGVKLIYENTRPQLEKQNAVEHSDAKNVGMLSGAVVGDRFVLFANHPKVLRDAINNVQAPSLSLTSSSQYQQALSLLPPARIGVTFLNIPILAKWCGLQAEAQTYQSQIIALELKQQGLLAETTLLATSSDQEIYPPAPELSQPVGALQYIPAGTGFSVLGSDLAHIKNTDLNQLWKQVSAQLSGSGAKSPEIDSDRKLAGYDAISRLVNQPLAALQARWGIDLPRDIFSWVEGEYALGVLPNSDQKAPDLVFVAEKSDAAEQGISRLDANASSQGLSISSLNLGEQKISAWTQLTTAPLGYTEPNRASITLKAKVEGVHATVGKYEIFTTSVEAMDKALKAPQSGSLVDNPKFQASIAPIPKPNKGYLYLDWTASQEILERQLPILKLLEVLGNPFVSKVRSLTISSYGSEKGLLKGSVFFRLNA